ncbi:protein ZNRD2 [Alligator mississippiensis]|uniref:protein ZNRD2 n=1 Tax=Alligator mississippiensis TaxID=8496 RepID=UPI00287759A9|nr:protein ZNRD2 [Alligator mississippiensis]
MALNAAGKDEELGWEPPSEAELKVLQARRERQDRISKLMGEYLLQGYRMLGDCCQDCGTILLQDQQKRLYCVACQELDSDVDKDNPALNPQAALSQVRERQLASSAEGPPSAHPPPPVPRPEHCEGAAAGLRAAAAAAAAVPPDPAEPLAAAETAVLRKLGWAARELQRSASIELSAQLCGLVRAAAEALRSLRELTPP